MSTNKSDLKDAFTFLWIAIVFFLITLDIAFPFVMYMMKVVLYFGGGFMAILSAGTFLRCLFGRKVKIETLSESEKK